jgi:tetratricopeptide (TPR) repeat protein
VVKKYNGVISHFTWINDFAAARNFNFAQVKDEDWILWLDADDVVRNPKILYTMDYTLDAIILPYEYSYDQFGNCVTVHGKTRLIQNNGKFEWIGAVHEDIRAMTTYNIGYTNKMTIEHRTSTERVADGTKRNLDIATEEMERRPDEPRSYWLMANAQMMASDIKGAISNYLQFLTMSNSKMDKILAWMRLAEAYIAEKDLKTAFTAAKEGMILDGSNPEPWFKMADISYMQGKWRHAKEFCTNALRCTPDELLPRNALDKEFNIPLLKAKACVELMEDEEAIKLLKACYKVRPLKALEILIYGLEHPEPLNSAE